MYSLATVFVVIDKVYTIKFLKAVIWSDYLMNEWRLTKFDLNT